MQLPKVHIAYSSLDFQKVATMLRPACNDYTCAPTSSITYNPEKETITLTSCSESKVNRAMIELQLLTESFSKRWGGKYLMTSQPSTSRALLLDSSRVRNSTNSDHARVFPIYPKDHRRLVQFWLKSVLPALPRILSERLGGNFAASLVRRGQTNIGAVPYIQIESPCLPGLAARKLIKESVSEICKKNNHEPISMHFTEGSVKKLNGEDGGDDDDGVERARVQRLEFNYSRPCSKPRMGASVGLLCSEKLSATLGGYVLIGGKKYMLTSEHFVSKSRELAIRDCDSSDYDKLTSPSKHDLKKMENNLKQTKRDLDGNIDKLMQRTYGNREIPEDVFNDLTNLTPALRDAIKIGDNVRTLLDQVTKPPPEYVVGTVEKLSLEPRTEIISRSLSRDVGLPNDQLMVKHQMDWALFDTNSQISQTGENRHKYRSNQDAIEDHYIEERDYANNPGDVCHETCGAESGIGVYYVGQRSRYRCGKVNVASLVCQNSSDALAWGIIDSDNDAIPYSDVAGDSGAWVIRKDDNKLMGQVHSYSYGLSQVLFTPIDVIFADIEEACGRDVFLPTCPFNPGRFTSAPLVMPLCSVPRTPPVQPYRFLQPVLVMADTPSETSPVEATCSETGPFELSIKTTSKSNSEAPHSHRLSDPSYGSPSTLPSLMESSRSSPTTPDHHIPSQSSEETDISIGWVSLEKTSTKSLPTILDELTISEIPELSLDQQGEDRPVILGSHVFPNDSQSFFRPISGTRAPTWPVPITSRGTQARRGLGASLPHATPLSTRPTFDKVADFGFEIGMCDRQLAPVSNHLD